MGSDSLTPWLFGGIAFLGLLVLLGLGIVALVAVARPKLTGEQTYVAAARLMRSETEKAAILKMRDFESSAMVRQDLRTKAEMLTDMTGQIRTAYAAPVPTPLTSGSYQAQVDVGVPAPAPTLAAQAAATHPSPQ